MGALKDKIASYGVETGIEFDQAYTTLPTGYGSNTENVALSLTGTAPTYFPAIGPSGSGAGSWLFPTATRIRTNSTAWIGSTNNFTDHDYAVGLWIKMESFPGGSADQATDFVSVTQSGASLGFRIGISGSSHPTNPSKLVLIAAATSTTFTSITLDTNWHYIVFRRLNQSGTNNIELYFDGNLIYTGTNTATGAFSYLNIGTTLSTTPGWSFYAQNYHHAPCSVLTPTAISEIWQTGLGAPININYTNTAGATASALMVDPSILTNVNYINTIGAEASALIVDPGVVATQQGDHVEITTSFTALAEFPSNIAVIANRNINIVITETLNASVELINNVLVSAGNSVDVSANEFIASAIFPQPFVAERPMLASAIMPNATPVVQASYYNLVKSLNPVFYYNFRQNTMQNFGSWAINKYEVGSTVQKNVASTGDMSGIDNGLSWKFTGNYLNAPNYIEVYPQESQGYAPKTYNPYAPPLGFDAITDLGRSRSYAIEYWANIPAIDSGPGVRFGIFDIRYKKTRTGSIDRIGYEITATLPAWSSVPLPGVPGPAYERIFVPDTDNVILNDWNHVVMNVFPTYEVDPNTGLLILTTNKATVNFWINGNLLVNRTYTLDYTELSKENVRGDGSIIRNYLRLFNTSESPVVYANPTYTQPRPYSQPQDRGFWDGVENLTPGQTMFDEVAIYEEALTNSQIIEHYSFIYNQNPNRNISAAPQNASAISGDHTALAQADRNIAADPMLSSSIFVMPVIVAGRSINYSALPLIGSALNTDVTVKYGTRIFVDAFIASAESKEGFHLNSIYSDYVQANVAPYRYVNFDTATPFADFGSDTDYSVTPTVIGGVIVNPDFGINGKSAKTAGTNYVTDGVILKESEHDDNWGTGNNSWHSSFWVQRALDDNSTTGLRVLWNLNGHNDSQNIILYHYQNKLHLQINNQTDAPITITSANNINVFDYERHNIVINSHHNNNKNHVYVYFDTILVLDQDINTYAVTTINNPIHVGANSESNNFPRLGVGCLITPFADTALPVIPTNTKLIIDEIYWDKNQILQAQVINVFGAMPNKTSSVYFVPAMLSDAIIADPQVFTSITIFADPMLSNATLPMPIIFTQFSNIYNANVLTCSAEMPGGTYNPDLIINADVFTASALFTNTIIFAGYIASPMTASISINNPSQVMGLPLTDLSDYIRYLRIESYTNEIFHYQEVR